MAKIQIEISGELEERLRESAKKNFRSLTKEVFYLLTEILEQKEKKDE